VYASWSYIVNLKFFMWVSCSSKQCRQWLDWWPLYAVQEMNLHWKRALLNMFYKFHCLSYFYYTYICTLKCPVENYNEWNRYTKIHLFVFVGLFLWSALLRLVAGNRRFQNTGLLKFCDTLLPEICFDVAESVVYWGTICNSEMWTFFS